MPKERILVVDDEADILELVRYNLTKEGYHVDCVASGEEAVSKVWDDVPDLIVLDLMLPGLNGLDVCKQLKGNSSTMSVPIIMLTAKGEDVDIVTGLELGADDYITKPFSPRVLIARLRTVLRRRRSVEPTQGEVIAIRGLVIDPGKHEVLVKGSPVDLTATQFAILNFLALRPGWVFTRNQIINAVKGEDYPVTERSVDVQIAGLRGKLKEVDEIIETVRGVGYRFKGQE